MKIEVGNIVITSDSKSVGLNKKSIAKSGDKAGQEVLTPYAWYMNLTQAMEGIVDQRVRESNATSFKELLAEVKALRQEIREMLGGI